MKTSCTAIRRAARVRVRVRVRIRVRVRVRVSVGAGAGARVRARVRVRVGAFLASGLDAKPGKTGSELVADEEDDEEEDEGDAWGIAVVPVESLIL